ncbi:uncharacterized protein LOC110850677 [Folsomia candida]|uniref:uncharacterized protein LOC110850677 n=1 Tax=Folsomia candida TaxID=158441 RepID=UPI000B902586|nr:uncharacterized protein LOC110850677 [Folsomia candida]
MSNSPSKIESMDTAPVTEQPSSSPATESKLSASASSNLRLKDFSLSTSYLLPPILESNLASVFLAPPVNRQSQKEPEECKKTWAKHAKQEQIEMDTESGFEIVHPDITSAADDDIIVTDSDFPSLPPCASAPPPVSAFVSAAIKQSQRSVTENNAPTFSTSDDHRLDFYFGVMDQTSKDTTLSLLKKAWAQDPTDTLKLLANVRDIRKGKGMRPQYQQCLYWIYVNHPKTLYNNLETLLTFGYWKDVLHLLMIAMFDGYMPPYFERDAHPQRSGKGSKGKKTVPTKYQVRRIKRYRTKNKNLPRKLLRVSEHAIKVARESRIGEDTEKRIYNQKVLQYFNVKKELIGMSNAEMVQYRLQHARDKLENDVKYRVFHVKVAELYAAQLIKDLAELKKTRGNESVKSGGGDEKKRKKTEKVLLAGKWAPTLEGHFDKYTLIGSTIALKIASLSLSDVLTSHKSIPVKTYLARKVYSKEYCGPLRRHLEIPEQLMSENKWDQVNYARVPAKSMTKNKTSFIKHDKDRFEAYLSCKKTKVAGASLKPVEIICQAMEMGDRTEPAQRLVLEKQWDSLVESMTKSGGLLKDAVSICDVSGSMSGVPMQAAIGLTLLTMKMTAPPWNSICITFSENPTLFNLDEKLPLLDKLESMRRMPWGMSTDLHKVFELIVSLGVENKLSNDQMPNLLFIFTDMEFNQACPGSNQTNFEAAKSLFQSKGYTMPTIAFWNLRDSTVPGVGKSTPVQKNELGAVLLSGFAAQTLTYVMNATDLDSVSPIQFMMDVINDERYKDLSVFD